MNFCKRGITGLKRSLQVFILLILLMAEARADGFTSIARSNAFLRKAEKAMKEKDFRLAARSYEDALKEDPDLPAETKLNLGHAYFQLGNKALAQKNYQAALAGLNSEELKSAACLQIGNLFTREKNYKTALEWFQKSLIYQPENRKARLNYELAWKLNRKKEEEKEKQQPEKNQAKEDSRNQQSKGSPEQENKNEENKSQQENTQAKGQNRDQNQNKKDENRNAEERKQNAKGKDGREENSNKEGQEQKTGEQKDADEPTGKKGEENPDENGRDSKKQTRESNQEDPDSYRMDKQKLRESGLSEEQARNMLQAMRQSEVKYLQQRRFKGKNSSRDKSGPRW